MRTMTDHGCTLDPRDIKACNELVPEHLREAVLSYVQEAHPVGDFLRAVISNDLFDAVARADEQSLAGLRCLCQWFYNYTPRSCYGSRDRYRTWLEPRVDDEDPDEIGF